MNFDYDLWPQIRPQAWKWRPRSNAINLIQLHATRSGQTMINGRPWTMEDERKSSSNWFTSEGNRVPDAPHEAAMCNVLVGNGTVTQVLPENIEAHHSLGHADRSGLSLEICQPLNSVAFLSEDLEIAAAVCREWSQKYGIPIKVLDFLSSDNREAPGEVRHDRSAQGQSVGKSDPGDQFPTNRQWEAMVKGDVDMALAEENRDRLNKMSVLNKLAAIVAANAIATKLEKDWGHLVVSALREE